MAASFIRDSIHSIPVSVDKYPDMNTLNDDIITRDIPEELQWFLNGVIMSKNPV